MKYFTVLLSLLCTITISNSYASDGQADLMKTFYLQPTFSKFEYITSSMVDKNRHIQPWQLKILQVFSTMAIYNNKSYPKEIINNFSQYSPTERELLINALYGSGNAHSVAIIKRKYRYNSDTSLYYSINVITDLQINDNADNLDQAWAAFFATGDHLYLTKILEYITSNKFLLIAAAEMLNREALCDVTKSTGNPEPS